MTLPGSVEYNSAVQSPARRFADPVLQCCSVEMWPRGGPRVRSGGFALTYRMIDPSGKSWAVRCFHNEVSDLQRRYGAISQYLPGIQSQYLTDFQYQERGILVGARWFPIVRMPWIIGDGLCVYIFKHLSEPRILMHLAQQIRDMASALERAGVAHGDLQEGNVLVTGSGDMKLVDYDGFYVPSLKGQQSGNRGLPDYQHPRRGDHDFGPTMDRFSALVLYLGIVGVACSADPRGMWRRFSPGDTNVLLAQKDFLNPESSAVLAELEQISGLAPMVRSFRSICRGPFDQVPTLEDFITTPSIVVAPARALAPVAARRQFPAVAAEHLKQLLSLEGNVVEVVGKVVRVYYDPRRMTVRNQPYALINLGDGDYTNGCFVIPLWWDVLQPLLAAGKDPHDYEGEWISITGLITVYHPKNSRWPPQPEILPSWYGNIAILSRADAQERLTQGAHVRLHTSPSRSLAGVWSPQPHSKTSRRLPTPMPQPATTQRGLEEEMRRTYERYGGGRQVPLSPGAPVPSRAAAQLPNHEAVGRSSAKQQQMQRSQQPPSVGSWIKRLLEFLGR
jgi:hypothetical protein